MKFCEKNVLCEKGDEITRFGGTDKGKQYRVLTKINSVTSGQAGGVFRQLFLQCR